MLIEDAKSNTGLWGTIIAIQANFYRVRLDSFDLDRIDLLCTRRTRLKKIGQTVMVGDRVLIEEPDWQNQRGAISDVLPRKTELQRPPVANAEAILLVFALEEPILDPWQLSRFLIKAESTSLELCLCLNKCDLITDKQQQQWQERLSGWGYQPIFISVKRKLGLETLFDRLKQKITVAAGLSGVGKSSLIEALIPQVDLRIGEVSGKLQKGRHTTRHVELFELPGGGLLADTPGFDRPDLDCNPSNLADYFPEARQKLKQGNCQFNNCLHRDEPNCVVRGNWERYEYYRQCLEEAISREIVLQQRPDAESNLKLKVKRAGKNQYEPKLATKKYRRVSRREKNQSLQDIYSDRSLEDFDRELEDF